jgi:hypothetical protein
MKRLPVNIATIIAIVILVFAFIAGVYPHHDHELSTFLVVWALAVAWLGGVLGTWTA